MTQIKSGYDAVIDTLNEMVYASACPNCCCWVRMLQILAGPFRQAAEATGRLRSTR
jgi:hypothetical protein